MLIIGVATAWEMLQAGSRTLSSVDIGKIPCICRYNPAHMHSELRLVCVTLFHGDPSANRYLQGAIAFLVDEVRQTASLHATADHWILGAMQARLPLLHGCEASA